MSVLCGVLLEEHWAEREGGRRARVFRVRIVNRVLDHFGLHLDDWGGRVYVLRDGKGRSTVVETTGLADPAPILYTLLTEPVVKHHFVPETVVVTVDAQHGLRHPESVKQAAAADRIVVTKVDLADPAELELRLARLNPTAEIVEAAFGDVDPGRLFNGGTGS